MPELKALFRAWEKLDPPPQPGSTIVSKHLQYIQGLAILANNTKMLHQYHLLTVAFFCTMQLVTIRIQWSTRQGPNHIWDITFYMTTKGQMDPYSIGPNNNASFGSITFQNPKNGVKGDWWTHHWATNTLFCSIQSMDFLFHFILWNSLAGLDE
jgi:hypothetical protein